MNAIVVSIGDELVLGQTVDTNGAHIAAALAGRGIATSAHHTVADDRAAIAAELSRAAGEADIVIVSGGIGPTDDDVTRFALADVLGEELVEDADAVRTLEVFFADRGRDMPWRNRVQSLRPASAAFIANPHGTAPGLDAMIGTARVFITPGVPAEMKPMLAEHILPAVDALGGETTPSRRVIRTCKINTFGLGESSVADRLGDLMQRGRNPLVGTTVSDGIVSVRVRSVFATVDETEARLNETIEAVEQAVAPLAFGREEDTLQDAVVSLCQAQGCTLATAESCTGGLVGAAITDVAGSSAVYTGGWVTYANEMKIAALGVDARLIAAHGAVSEPVARAMAAGAMRLAKADMAVGITGIAGPGGGGEDKPVGTVWIGLATREHTAAMCCRHGGGRAQVRDRATKTALQMMRLQLLGLPLDVIQFGRVNDATKT